MGLEFRGMMWVRERSFSDMDDLRVIGTDGTSCPEAGRGTRK